MTRQKQGNWYRKAADQHHPGSCYQLGNMYENGFGVGEDLNEALKMVSQGAANLAMQVANQV